MNTPKRMAAGDQSRNAISERARNHDVSALIRSMPMNKPMKPAASMTTPTVPIASGHEHASDANTKNAPAAKRKPIAP